MCALHVLWVVRVAGLRVGLWVTWLVVAHALAMNTFADAGRHDVPRHGPLEVADAALPPVA